MRRNGYIINRNTLFNIISNILLKVIDICTLYFLNYHLTAIKYSNKGDPWFRRDLEEKFYFREKFHVTPKRNISAEVRVVPLYLGLMVTPLIVGEHSSFPRLQF